MPLPPPLPSIGYITARWTTWLLLATVLLGLMIGLQPAAVAGDWPRFLGPTSDSKSVETGMLTDWSSGGLPVLWARPLGKSYGIGAENEE